MTTEAKHRRRSRRSHRDMAWANSFRRNAFRRENDKAKSSNIKSWIQGIMKKNKQPEEEESDHE